jgi:hypothetical protein
MRGFTRTTVTAATTALFLIIASGLAYANDTIFPDGDTGVASPNLHYGSGNRDCTTRGSSVAGQITVNYNGNGTDPAHHFTPGETLTVSLAPASGSITANTGTVPNVPATWGSSPSDSFTIPISTTVPSTLADGTYGVDVTVTGNTSRYTAGDGSATPGKPKYNVVIECGTTPAPANVAPVIDTLGTFSGAEGSNINLTGTAHDPDGDPLTYGWSVNTAGGDAGISCPITDASNTDAAASVNCNDDSNGGTFTLTFSVSDDHSHTTTQNTTLSVTNANPAISSVSQSPNPVNEGSPVTLTVTASDPGSNDTLSYSFDWDNNGTYESSSASHTFGDNGSFTVGVKATDDDSGFGTSSLAVAVSNVNPSITGTPSFTYNSFTGVATAGVNFTDPGWLDTHTASFNWGSLGTVSGTVTEENGEPDATGSATSSKTLAPGCYNLSVTATVTDDDGGSSGPQTVVSNQQVSIYSVGFLPPIKDGERNIAKYGNVVPVKVSITDPCNNNAPVTTANLFVSYYQGTGDPVDTTPVVTAESVSAADGTSGQMRLADGFYIFNFTTKPLQAGKDYTIRIWKDAMGPGGGATFLLDAVLMPKK